MLRARSMFGESGRTTRLAAFAKVAGAAAAFLLVLTVQASAQILISPSESVGSVPGTAGTGLDGNYYFFPSNSIGNLSQGDALVAGASGPSGTFTTTNVCFPNCTNGAFNTSSGGFTSFTNGNASNINFTITPPTTFMQTVLQMNGFVAITTPGTYTFSIDSDDGSSLSIAGTQIDIVDGIHGNATASNQVNFSAAGLYAIAIDYFQNGGGAALSLFADTPQGTCYFGCQTTVQSSPDANSLFYSTGDLQGAPAPTIGGGLSGAAVLAALAAAGLARRRLRL